MRRLFFMLPIAASLLAAPAAAQPSAGVDALLAQSRAALGGDAISHLKGVEVQADATIVGVKGTQRAWNDFTNNTYAEYQSAGPLSGGDGFDGTNAWQQDASGIVHVVGSPRDRLQAIDQAYTSGYALWSPDRGGASVTDGGVKTADGVSYHVLDVTPKGGSAIELWFDDKGFPRRSVTHLPPATFTATFDDYRPVAGVMFPYHFHGASDAGNEVDTRVTSVQPNPSDLASRIAMPATNVHDFSIEGGGTMTSVPFELIENHVYLSVKLNGKGPYRFVFDSGGANVIDPAVLAELGGSAQGNAQGQGVGSATEGVQFTKLATLEVGRAKLTDQYFAVAPVRQGFGVAGGKPADGLIGYEVLARFITTNDYQNRRVIFRMPSSTLPTSLGGRVPFVFDDTTPMVSGEINGVAAQMTVDTGSRAAISIFKPFVNAHPSVAPAKLSAPGVTGFGVGGASYGQLGRVASLAIGPYTMRNIIGDYSVQEKGAFANVYTAANIGGAVWRRFAVTFDYWHRAMYLAPNASFAKPEEFDRSGLFLVNRNGVPTVFAVRDGTPAAAAGLAKGDAITSINGRSTGTMPLVDVRNALMAPAGTQVRLSVTKGGAAKSVTLTLQNYV